MKLTTHFSAADFAVSDSFPGLVQPVPAAWLPKVQNLANLLQELQDRLDRTYGPGRYRIRITSAYRPAALNARVGGAATSLHTTADAADFIIVDSKGASAPTLLPIVWGWIRDTMTGRVGEVELTTKHVHITNPTDRKQDVFLVLVNEPMKRFPAPPTDKQVAAVVAAVAAVIALRSL